MRRALLRSTLISVAIAMAVLAAPSTVIGWLILRMLDEAGLRGEPLVTREAYLLVTFGAAALAILLAVVATRHQAKKVAAPLAELADQAERLGAGDTRQVAIHSGIEEVDRVSRALTTSARQLMESLSSERDFASDASHQLRTPLTALLMRLEEISLTDDLDDAHDEALIAIEQVERLTDTVDQLLSRSRQVGNTTPGRVSLDSVLAALQREWQPPFGAQHRAIHIAGERGMHVATTVVALSQILTTLIENSLIHGAGTVKIDARRSGPSVVVEVSDEGPGIDPTLAPHIFERAVSTKSTGIGLSLARDLAESHGGRLELVQSHPVLFALFLSSAESNDEP